METAEEVLAEDWLVSRDDIQRPAQSEEEIVAEFWEKVGYPTPASRFWERSSPTSSIAAQGTSLSPVCRSSEPLSVERSGAVVPRPPGRLLRRPPMRMGWRGPLPRPRITPPPCLGDFLPVLPSPTAAVVSAAAPVSSEDRKSVV